MPQPLDPMVKLGRENERLKIANSDLRSLNRKLMRRGGGYDDFITELREVLAAEDKFTLKYKGVTVPPELKVADPSYKEIACTPVSDLHLAEEIRLEDTLGVNVYTPIIAASRLWEHCQQLKQKLVQRMSLNTIEMIWSPLLGDMVSGTIHYDQIFTNSLSDAASVILCTRLLFMFYLELAALGLPIEIDSIVGNHPRTTAKMPNKRQAHTNLDWMIYEQLSDRLAGSDQFKVKVWTSQIGMRRLYDWKYLFEHGIDVHNGQEEKFESDLRGLFDDSTYREFTREQGASFDMVVIGNLHKQKILERTMINGCYPGQNELGVNWRLKTIRAKQLLWGVSRDRVRTWIDEADMTQVRTDKVTNPFAEYAAWFMKKNRR